MDVSRSPDSLTSYSRLPYHVPLARVLVCSRSRLTCFPLLAARTVMDSRLVSGYLFVSRFSFCLVDSSLVSLFLDSDSSLTRFPFTYVCTCISQTIIYMVWDGDLFPIFNLLCNHPKGVTCEIPCTLLVLSSLLAKATALRVLGVISSVYSLTGSEVQPTQCTSVCS